MPAARKKPCSICRHWFRPDPRVGSRQRTCRNPDCQATRRRKKQKAWRERHPDYFIARRIQDRAKRERPPEPLRLPPPLNRLPWDIAPIRVRGSRRRISLGLWARLCSMPRNPSSRPIVLIDLDFPAHFPSHRRNPRSGLFENRCVSESRVIPAGVSPTGSPV